jgi:hypothetical protein
MQKPDLQNQFFLIQNQIFTYKTTGNAAFYF